MSIVTDLYNWKWLFCCKSCYSDEILAIINYFGKKQDDKWEDLKPTPLVVDVMSIALWSNSLDFSNTDSNSDNMI